MFEQVEPPTAGELRDLRKKMGVTQADMATFIGVSESSYRNYEAGRWPAPPLISRVLCWIEGGYRPPEFIALGISLVQEDPEGA